MPLAGNKGEAKINLFAGMDGLSLQGSYCIDSHIVVLGGISSSSNYTEDGPSTSLTMGDIGAGYYERISKSGRFEVIGGLGYGSTLCEGEIVGVSSSETQQINLRGNVIHLFGQADIGLVKKNIEFGFGIRVSNMTFNGKASYTNSDSGKVISVSNQNISGSPIMLEPCLMLSIGSKNVKWHLSVGGALNIAGLGYPDQLGQYGPTFVVTTGITFNIFRNLE